ncbi:F-box protein SKIP23-like [Chenopodium quinoa]|uniref:F-box protein SKIP23-like n=1 Tax=Chenopodium quinoa TaxID=63459 RepID=UPI000B778C7E|nr:F-box protein SKIP23-like [Chenopodium quinoa]
MTISHETEKHDEEEGQWKNLTNDILALILKRLNTKADLCRFRSICKSWRFFATPIQPHLIFPLTLPPLNPNSRPFSLSPTLIYIISPQFTHHNLINNVWLTKVSETGENKWGLLNPLTKHKMYFSSSGVFKERIDLLDFRNLEVGRSYRLQLINDHGDEDTFDFEEFSSSISLRKVVVRIGEEISVLGLYGYGQIAVWNSGDKNWKIIETGKKEKKNEFDDVICFDEKFYAVDRTGRLVMINPASRELVEVVGTSTAECSGQYTYLVESNFRLYLVNKIVNPMPTNYYDDEEEEWVVDKSSVGKPLGFNVLMLNKKEKCWERVSSIGNNVFFVSRDATFSVCAKDLGWSKGNCVYFEGVTGYDDEADMSFGLNAGVYTLEDGAILAFDSSVDRWTGIFWPPSRWFVENMEYPECEMLG